MTAVHPSLAKYRIPVFRELARRPGIELRVAYGTSRGITNVSADGFQAVPCSRWEGKVAGSLLMFQWAEWAYCSPRYADVVVLRWTPRSLTLPPALLRSRLQGVATVLWGHGYSKQERSWWRGPRNWMARQGSSLVFYEPRTRDEYVRNGWDPQRLFVALNSIDHADIDQAREWWINRPSQLAHFRQEQAIDAGPLVLFVSRLQPANRVDLLIQATVQLAKEIPGLKCAIIGNGAAEKGRLQALARQEEAGDSVVFLDGVYDEMKLAPWFLSADVFCYPANVGLSLLHALWYGLPVVTSDNRAVQNPEFIALEHGVNGLTYQHGSVSSLADALRKIINCASLRRSMSDAARRTVEDRFTIRNMVDGLEAAIRYANQQRQVARRS